VPDEGSGTTFFHVTSVQNRESIAAHGLDWRRMQRARGIAGSDSPELQGCFLCWDGGEADWFVRINNTGGPVDVWEVVGIDSSELVESSAGHHYLPVPIPPSQVRLVRQDQPVQQWGS
jgi:hypothetical protein